ncbi:argonaute/piwi family protein [Roseiconus sp. JC912]
MTSTTQRPTKLLPLTLSHPKTETEWIAEPGLRFGDGQIEYDPKVGIPLFGPRSLGTSRHKSEIHVGFIGTSETVAKAQRFYETCCKGIDGNEDYHPFPGCTSEMGFRCNLDLDASEVIRQHEYDQILSPRLKREKFDTLLSVLKQKLYLASERDRPTDYVVIALPDELFRKCRSVEFSEKGVGKIYRNLRRSIKAVAMSFGVPTQIILEKTIDTFGTDETTVHPAQIAWNLFTGMYFKVEGLPWGPSELTPGTCYIGISFFRPLGDSSSLRTSVVQAFDENGQGLVLRGHKFKWDEKKYGKSPHLPEDQAKDLIEMVLDQYKLENEQRLPQRVVIHKTSRFEPEEQRGFQDALKQVSRFDLVSLCPTSESRLLRTGQYPPMRGTVFHVGDLSYCYTSGYMKGKGYPHGHVPSPIQIADHVGDTARTELLREVLALTKMNWNSANMFGLMPITLRFSRLVGDILREIPENETPKAKYKFYM